MQVENPRGSIEDGGVKIVQQDSRLSVRCSGIFPRWVWPSLFFSNSIEIFSDTLH